MNATVKFYTAFLIVAAIVIGLAFFAGYRAGYGAGRPGAHRTAPSGHATVA